MARATTAGELLKLRADGQKTALGLAIHSPSVVYTAQVNQAFSSFDQVTQVIYTGGWGTLGNVLAGMTMYVGSAAGAYDKGMVRIRKAPSGTVFYIGETSEVAWANGDYLTVVDEFGLWAKHLWVDSGNKVWMDFDIGYSGQHAKPAPVPVLGPMAAVLRLTGASVSIQLNGSGSWVLNGTITAYSWSTPGGDLSGGTTATPTVTYYEAGTFRVSCTVTASNGATATGYRWIFVNPSGPAMVLNDCSGNFENGGWAFSATAFAGAGTAAIRDRAMVALWARDWYGASSSDEGSIGPIANYENVICMGWIDGETIEQNPEQGQVTFTVQGPAYWIDKIPGFASGFKHSNAAAKTWLEFQNLTVDKALWQLAHWRSTMTAVMDVYPSNDGRVAKVLQAPSGSLWQQMNALTQLTILARPICDRYGRLFVDVDQQYLATGSRGSIPIVQSLTKGDWQGTLQLTRRILPQVSLLDVSGVVFDGSNYYPLLSKASGKSLQHYGRAEKVEQLLLSDQASLNTLCGLMLAQRNNEYPAAVVDLAANNRMIDLSPRQYLALSVNSGDTPRGVSFTDKRFIPRRVTLKHDPKDGWMTATIELEGETSGPAGVTYLPPNTGYENRPPNGPTTPNMAWDPFHSPYWNNPPPVIPFPPPIPPAPSCPLDAPANGPFFVAIGSMLYDNYHQSIYIAVNGGATARKTGAANPTVLILQVQFETRTGDTWSVDDSATWAEAWLCDEVGNRLYPGTWSGSGKERTVSFAPPANTLFYSVEIALASYSDFAFTAVNPGGLWVSSLAQDGGGTTWTVNQDECVWVRLPGALYVKRIVNVDFAEQTGGLMGRPMWAIATDWVTGVNSATALDSVGVEVTLRTQRFESALLPARLGSGAYGFSATEFTDNTDTYLPYADLVIKGEILDENHWGQYAYNGTDHFANRDMGRSYDTVMYTWYANTVRLITELLLDNPYPYSGKSAVFMTETWLRGIATKRLAVKSGVWYNLCP